MMNMKNAMGSFTEKMLENLNHEFDNDNEAETSALLLKVCFCERNLQSR